MFRGNSQAPFRALGEDAPAEFGRFANFAKRTRLAVLTAKFFSLTCIPNDDIVYRR